MLVRCIGRCLAVVLSASAVHSAAEAGEAPVGFYVSGTTGFNFEETSRNLNGRISIDTDPGAVGTAAIGYAFGNGFRAELEGDYRDNDISAINTLRVNKHFIPLKDTVGAAKGYGLLANGYYDLPLASWALPFTPYVGVGAGYGRYDLSSATGGEPVIFSFSPFVERRGNVAFGSANVFAYQVIAGASFPIPAMPGLAATLEYRYFGTTHGNVMVLYRAVPPATEVALRTNRFDMTSNAVQLGLRYTLQSPHS